MSPYRALLSEHHYPAILAWEVICQQQSAPQQCSIARIVLENLEKEAQLERQPFYDFLVTLEQHCAGSNAAGLAREPFEQACKLHTLKGPRANISPRQVLGRVQKRADLAKFLALSQGWPLGDQDSLLEQTLADTTSEQERRSYFAQLSLGKPGGIVWGGFDPAFPGRDPLENTTAARARAMLGLDVAWYPDGEPLLWVRYTLPVSVTPHIPSVADGGWSQYWMAAPADTGWGLTRDLDSNTPCLGEVVHAAGMMDWTISPAIPRLLPESIQDV